MKNKNLRRPYAAPNAELVCLVPVTPIASDGKKNWQWGGSGDNKWKQNSWGVDFNSILQKASVTGLMEWVDEEELQ